MEEYIKAHQISRNCRANNEWRDIQRSDALKIIRSASERCRSSADVNFIKGIRRKLLHTKDNTVRLTDLQLDRLHNIGCV